MTGLKILFASILVLMSVSKCNEYSAEKTCNDATQRGKIISVLMNNEKYLKEVIDSMKMMHEKGMCGMEKIEKKGNLKK
jgi:hypothetical protein